MTLFPYDAGPYSLENAELLLDRVDCCIAALSCAAAAPPVLDHYGYGSLYSSGELDARMNELSALIGQLRAYGRAAAAEIERLERNREVIARDADRLHGETAGHQYRKAQEDLTEGCESHRGMQARLEHKIDRSEQALRHAAARRFSPVARPRPWDPLMRPSPSPSVLPHVPISFDRGNGLDRRFESDLNGYPASVPLLSCTFPK